MKIGKIITSGPNIQWWLATALFVCLGGWKGLLIWAGINVFFVGLALIAYKELHPAFFKIFKHTEP